MLSLVTQQRDDALDAVSWLPVQGTGLPHPSAREFKSTDLSAEQCCKS